MITSELFTLGQYLAGEFDNELQARAEPNWYVHLRLWLRPVPLFVEDSITLFAEQAAIVNLDNPYRPRILRLTRGETGAIEVRHYMFEDIVTVRGAGRDPEILQRIGGDTIQFLSSCTLAVTVNRSNAGEYEFTARSTTETPCQFNYQGTIFQVALGFDATADGLKTYDKGIDPNTGKAIWGALMGPYIYRKREDFSGELPARL
jgi:hypothetical protein